MLIYEFCMNVFVQLSRKQTVIPSRGRMEMRKNIFQTVTSLPSGNEKRGTRLLSKNDAIIITGSPENCQAAKEAMMVCLLY